MELDPHICPEEIMSREVELAAVHGLSGLFRAVSAVEPFTLSPPSHSVPVPNRPIRLCGRKATLNLSNRFKLRVLNAAQPVERF